MNEKKSFWPWLKTLPGILTGIAVIITATGGLIGTLYAAGLIGAGPEPAPATPSAPAPTSAPAPAPAPAPATFSLTISVYGNGTTSPSPGRHTYEEGAVVYITNRPDSGWEFDRWSGDASGTSPGLDITIDSDMFINAHFKSAPAPAPPPAPAPAPPPAPTPAPPPAPAIYAITISVDGNGTTSPSPGRHTYEEGAQVSVTALPAYGWKFDHWSGTDNDYVNPTTVTMNTDKTVTAYFVPKEVGPVLDQSNEPVWDGGWMNIDPTNKVGQSFVPQYPVLVAVEVNIVTGNTGRGGDSITMKILKDGLTLASSSLFVSEGFNGWLRFDIPGGGTTVPVGDNLIIQLEDTGKIVFGWKYAGDTYPFGSRFYFGKSQSGDFFFRTYGTTPG